jgi:peptidoglycan hydrolase-like protein with peptidoglycan-binding domain
MQRVLERQTGSRICRTLICRYQANTNQISPNRLRTSQVREIQQTLESKKEKAARVDGKWGSETEAALKEFPKISKCAGERSAGFHYNCRIGLKPHGVWPWSIKFDGNDGSGAEKE